MVANTVAVSVGQAFEVPVAGWQAQLAGAIRVSWMLHGRSGIGKTEIVQQLADRTGALLFDLRLTTIKPQDMRGLP